MKRFLILAALALLCQRAAAQIGDKPGEEQRPIVPASAIPPSPALPPAEALKTFKLALGFHIELVASEPLVQDPVVMEFGPDGRLWVVEMRGYMPDLDGNGEDAPVGRVVVLSSSKGDGHFDKSSVFVDKLILPRAMLLVRDGLLVGAPPNLVFWQDTDGDGVADKQTVVATDYGVQVDPKRPQLANPERAPNSLVWGLDNWIYSAAYIKKFRFANGQWESAPTVFRGQWGLSQDDFGHLFHNSNSDQLRGDIIFSHYLGRNPDYQRAAGVNVKIANEQYVWPARVNPGVNRGYRPEMLRDWKLKEFTAACSPWIYRGDLFPREFYGNAFVAEPAGNLIKRNLLTSTNGTLVAHDAYHEAEFLASTDERFRPVDLKTGPDGALYIVDLYRGVLQHRISLTSYLRKQSEDRGLALPVHYGRIYRVVPDGAKPGPAPRMTAETPAQWVQHLSHPNSWWRETAQRLLVEHGDLSVVPALKELALHGREAVGRLHALCTLDGLKQLDEKTVEAALNDASPVVRASAVRLCEPLFQGEDKAEVLTRLLKLTSESVPEVQLQLMLTLGEARDPQADYAMANLARSVTNSMFLRDALYTGLYGRELSLLERLNADPAWKADDAEAGKVLGGLAKCVFNSHNAEQAGRLLELIAAQPQAVKRQMALLDGVIASAPVTGRKPVKFKAEPAGLTMLKQAKGTSVPARVAKIDALMVWPGKPGVKPEPVLPPLTAAEQARYDLGKTLFAGSCAACHQLHGLGMDGLAPPLADSEWANGPAERMVRIALHGVRGPLKVQGRTYNLDMPAFGLFDDDQLAAILTYARREWENTGSPVTPQLVKQIRAETVKHIDAWTQEELQQIH